MANTVRNVGFRLWGNPLRASQYIANGIIYQGDPVQMGSSGNVIQYAGSSATGLLGVAANYASGQGAPILIWDHPDQQFVVQADGQVNNQNIMGLNFQITQTTGSSQYKISRMQLTASSTGTGATMPIKALFIDSRPDNALGSYADVVVLINNHIYKGGTGTTGI